MNNRLSMGQRFDTKAPANSTCGVMVEFTAGSPEQPLDVVVSSGEFAAQDVAPANKVLWLRNLPATATVAVTPGGGAATFQGSTSVTGSVLIQFDNQELKVDLPTANIGGQKMFDICRFDTAGGTIVVHAPEVAAVSPLSDGAARAREALVGDFPTGGRKLSSVTVIIDNTASMGITTSTETMKAMLQVTAGVLDTLLERNHLEVFTADGRRLEAVRDTVALSNLNPDQQGRNAGFELNVKHLNPQAPIVVITDGAVPQLASHPQPVHVVSSRALLDGDATSHTVVDQQLAQSFASGQRDARRDQIARNIRDHLTGGF